MNLLPRGLTQMAAGTAAGQLISLMGYPVIARFYTPESFGYFASISAVVSVVAVAATLRCEMAIISARTDAEATRLAMLCMGAAVITTLAMLLLVYPLVQLNVFPAVVASPAGLLLFGILVLATAATAVTRPWALRQHAFGAVAQGSLLQHVIRTVVGMTGGVLGAHWLWLAAGIAVSRTYVSIHLFRRIRVATGAAKRASFRSIACTAQRHSSFIRWGAPDAVLDSLAALAPVPLIAATYGADEAGQFAFAFQVASLPAIMITASVADAFHVDIAASIRAGHDCSAKFLRMLGTLTLIAAGPSLALAYGGTFLFTQLFGETWSPAGTTAGILAIWTFSSFVVSPVSRIVFVLHGQRVKLLYSIFTLVVSLGTILGMWYFRQSPLQMIVALSLAKFMCYGGYLGVLGRLIHSHNRSQGASQTPAVPMIAKAA